MCPNGLRIHWTVCSSRVHWISATERDGRKLYYEDLGPGGYWTIWWQVNPSILQFLLLPAAVRPLLPTPQAGRMGAGHISNFYLFVQSRGGQSRFYSVVRICSDFLLNAISGQETHPRVSLGVLVDELG